MRDAASQMRGLLPLGFQAGGLRENGKPANLTILAITSDSKTLIPSLLWLLA
jgi:hypothetical protein